ncbi:zinc finger protein, putative [Pediculus humanus corporis]|uniref:Zinc finger protein, putative n=1 Tax=Pediculus humanus subsp. corporis TaxID=121224 RepID=E0VGF7_PEDHC|nr:zinc finger protein, putative [Pediculus humanus corporis]EEB12463.1 zinc finger protein, putative [Pediculus humanus corporis]
MILPTILSLIRHVKFECGKQPQFQCPHCPIRTTRNSTLKKHIGNRHFGGGYEKKIIAGHNGGGGGGGGGKSGGDSKISTKNEECGKKYSQSPTLWRHVKYECGKGPQFHCPYCMKGFTRKFTMLKHADKQHEKEYKDDGRTTSFDIKPEMFDNTQERRNEIFRRQQVIRNQRLESEFGIKPGGFKCTNCGKMYNQQASLWRHSKYECGKGPQFQCPYCALKVTQKCYMRKHILRRHADKVFNYMTC